MTFPVPSVKSTPAEEALQRTLFEGDDLWQERVALREQYGYQSMTAKLAAGVATVFAVITLIPGLVGIVGSAVQGETVTQFDLISLLVVIPLVIAGFLWHRYRMTMHAVATVQALDSVESALQSRVHDRVRNDLREQYCLDITVTAAGTYCTMYAGTLQTVIVDYVDAETPPRMELRAAPVVVG